MSVAHAGEAQILEALRAVIDPELHVDIVSLGMIEDLKVEADRVSLTVNLTTPGCPLKAQIEKDVKEALSRVPGVGSINLKMGARVRKSIETTGDLIPEVANAVAIGSGKGGVGKSTVSVADNADADCRTALPGGDHHAFHRTFLCGGHVPRQR